MRCAAVGALVAAVGLAACGGSGDENTVAGSDGGTGGSAASSSGGSGATSSGGSAASSSGGSGGGFEVDGGGGSAASDGGANCNRMLTGTVRDFQQSHEDFEFTVATDKGIVQDTLGPDGKPQYAGPTPTTHSQALFEQWYNDVPGVNQSIPVTIELVDAGGGTYTYNNSAFFPIDGQGFGNEGNAHNYHFTFELRMRFRYEGGEVFTFTGDDDLFVFVNRKLAIDLGGVHGAQTGSVDLDAEKANLGIEVGNEYSLDFFFAERHTSESNFRIDTTIDCLETPVVM